MEGEYRVVRATLTLTATERKSRPASTREKKD
jgi:hypothetical protein